LIGKTAEGIIQGDRTVALALGYREKPGFGAGRRMNVNCPPISDDKTLGTECFQPDVIGAGCDRALDASVQQPLPIAWSGAKTKINNASNPASTESSKSIRLSRKVRKPLMGSKAIVECSNFTKGRADAGKLLPAPEITPAALKVA
jgi:hypothetical protein